MNSNGESRATGDGEAWEGVGRRASVGFEGDARDGVGIDAAAACDEAGRPRLAPLSTVGESTPLERKLGSGSDDGAGDAWNVAPAKAPAAPALGMEVGWEV